MGLRVQRSIRLGKAIRLNISKSGIGISMGIGPIRIGTGPRGPQFSVNLPGSGLSYRTSLGGKSSKKKETRPAAASTQTAQTAEPRAVEPPGLPQPGLFAPGHEKSLVKGLEDYQAGRLDEALAHFLDAAPHEAGAAILAAAILSRQEGQEFKASELLEPVVENDDDFPTALMQKYLADMLLDIAITPNVTANVPLDGLAAPLLLVELYQKERRVREAITLLEEIDALADAPALTLSLCELYLSRNLWDNIIERAKGIEPDDDITLATLIMYGLAMLEKGLDEAAIAVFSKALRPKKGCSPELLLEARYWRAVVYQEQGKTQPASVEFQKIFAEAPDYRDVAQRLADLSIA